jgi:Spy/CpxP family protein refolding chaperone
MGMFGNKEGGFDATTGEWGSDNVGMMKMLAGMPHMMRKPMMKGRINQLLSLTEEQRQESIRDMIGAFHSSKVKPKSRESLVATRIEIVGELSDDKRRTIISSRYEALKAAPELDQQDRDVQKKIISKSTRDKFQSTWDQVRSE